MDLKIVMYKAYKRNLGLKQWPTLKPELASWNKDAGWRNGATPLLISECARLIIKWDPVKQIFRAHPCNMPEVSIQVVEIVGTIIRREDSFSYLKLDVWDGSGSIEVNFHLKRDKKEKQRRAKIDKKFGMTPEMSATASRVMKQVICRSDDTLDSDLRRERFQDENRTWWESTYEGMYGKNLDVGDYVNVFGFCALKYNDPDDTTPWDLGVLPKMIFVGLHVDAIDEETYDRKLTNIIHEGIYKYGKIRPPKPSSPAKETTPVKDVKNKAGDPKPIVADSVNDLKDEEQLWNMEEEIYWSNDSCDESLWD